jgi:predicted dehydrogenase
MTGSGLMAGVSPVRVALIGIHGHGRVHLVGLLERERAGTLELCGLADRLAPTGPDAGQLLSGRVFDTDAARLLRTVRPDVAVIATPIHTHAQIAEAALEVGAHLLLEKPPVTGLDAHDRLAALASSARRHCQVGFQAFGSSVVRELLDGVEGIGAVEGISVVGGWRRDEAYYARSAWAGHRRLGEIVVADGAMTNPFAHGVALALRLADPSGTRPIRSARFESFHAYPIETDDTSSARIELEGAAPVTVAVTLCAEREFEPYVQVRGSAGRATVWYTEDRLLIEPREGESVEIKGDRVELIDDLVACLDADPAGDALLSPLRATRSFTAVLEAIQDGPEATPIPRRYLRVGAGSRMIPGIEDAVVEAGARGLLFSELGGLPWADAGADRSELN